MAAVPAIAHYNSPLFLNDKPQLPDDACAKLQRSLDALFPDLLVHSTRNFLLSMTTSLTKVSGKAHQYFARLSQILAFERMMRGFLQFTAALSPFPMNFAAANVWAGTLPPCQQAPSMWRYAAPHQLQSPAMCVAGMPFSAMSLPGMTLLANVFQSKPKAASHTHPWSDCSALFILPLALLVAAPVTDRWWNFGF